MKHHTWVMNTHKLEIHELIHGEPKDERCQIGEITEEHRIDIHRERTIRDILENERSGFSACAWCKPLNFESKR